MATKKTKGRTKFRPLVAILMGSKSDLAQMQPASDVLAELGVAHEVVVTSAHRTPEATATYTREASERGIRVLIAGAGLAAHLAGAVAAHTELPVLGVPLEAGSLGGLDALLATVQMPPGIPVGTLAVGSVGAANAGLLAAQILALSDSDLGKRVAARRARKAQEVPGVVKQVGS